jgi:hypothetical protein
MYKNKWLVFVKISKKFIRPNLHGHYKKTNIFLIIWLLFFFFFFQN